MTTVRLTSYAGLKAQPISAPGDHQPEPLTEARRYQVKKAFSLAINKAKTRDEARRLNKMRARFFSGHMTADEAIIAWLEVTSMCKPNRNQIEGRFHVSAA